ncbi:MAG: hypothetical protein KKH04_13235, partial [Proteobacteria bacterium]|nr:hypothetical protein [Pseudomonadota bacterium]
MGPGIIQVLPLWPNACVTSASRPGRRKNKAAYRASGSRGGSATLCLACYFLVRELLQPGI